MWKRKHPQKNFPCNLEDSSLGQSTTFFKSHVTFQSHSILNETLTTDLKCVIDGVASQISWQGNFSHVIKNMLPKIAAKLGGGGGRGLGSVTRQSFIRGGTAPRSNPLPFYIPFSAKKVPFSSVPSIDRWCPFHNPSSEFWVYSLSWIRMNHKTRKFSRLYHSHKLSFCQPFWALLQTEMRDFPTLS